MKLVAFLFCAFLFLLTCSLKAHGDAPLTIVYGDSYAPFAWKSGNTVRGIQVEFVEEILSARLNIPVVHESCPWKRCQILVKQGFKDGFFTVPTNARSEYSSASQLPFYTTRFLMHTSKDNPFRNTLEEVSSLKDLESLSSIRHIHMLGSGWHENALKSMDIVDTIPDASMIPFMLVNDRADLYIEQAEMFKFQALIAGVSKQVHTFESPTIRSLGWHIFIGKQSRHQHLLPRIDALLNDLNKNGELEEIRQAIFARYGL